MPAADDVLGLIKNRFAGREALIERVLWRKESFRSLCEDYRDCLDALERMREQDSPRAARRREEYVDLLEELGCEIRAWLEREAPDAQGAG